MKKFYFLLILLILSAFSCNREKNEPSGINSSAQNQSEYKGAEIITSMGTIEIEFMSAEAPITTANFIRYTKANFYSDTIFHRVIKNFMIQGGGFNTGFKQKRTYNPIKNEASSSSQNKRGTVAMARTSEIDSATSQFFINLVDNDFLNQTDATDPSSFGYCVFAKVTKGMDVVDAIGSASTTSLAGFEDFPQKQIVIKEVKLISE
ncbi:MAG: peptidylprolyl isomerase [Spirochaetes bacterium]|nr:peptidylprolyl isomerase [Spirochaetota bacterium]